jgi:HEPN domain-containing protein
VTLEGIKAKALRALERLNVEARCPDALPDAIPAEYVTTEDAGEAIAIAAGVVAATKSFLG